MALKCTVQKDANNQRLYIVVVDDSTSPPTEHPEYGKVSIALTDIVFADLPNIGVIQLRNVGNDVGGKPVYLLASGIPQLGGGGGNYAGTWNQANSYTAGQIVRVTSNTVINVGGVNVVLTPGVYGCAVNTALANPAQNAIPQYPEPLSGTVCWQLISLGVQIANVCSSGSKSIYINASGAF